MSEHDPDLPGRFVVCVSPEDEVDLQAGKIYEMLPDSDAERHGFVRVIDDSGEDYLYLRTLFIDIDLPPDVEEVIRRSR